VAPVMAIFQASRVDEVDVAKEAAIHPMECRFGNLQRLRVIISIGHKEEEFPPRERRSPKFANTLDSSAPSSKITNY